MVAERSVKELIMDRVLLLYLIERANEAGELYGVTKLMKLIFLSEHSMLKDRVKGFNYSFYRWHLGAFTPEVYEDLDYLIWNNLVTERVKIELTDRGRALLNSIRELLEENREILRYIDENVNRLAREDVYKIMQIAYKTKVKIPIVNIEVKVIDLPLGTPLTTKMDELEAELTFIIDNEWLETLDILLDSEAYESVMAGLMSARTARSEKLEL